jgi:hypothetical protein
METKYKTLKADIKKQIMVVKASLVIKGILFGLVVLYSILWLHYKFEFLETSVTVLCAAITVMFLANLPLYVGFMKDIGKLINKVV